MTIPVGPFALIGDDSIGRGIVEVLRDSRSPAVLMRNHGPFTIGRTARDAVKAAVMVEDVARTVHISRQLGATAADRRRRRRPPCSTGTRTSTARPVRSRHPPGEPAMIASRLVTSQVWLITGSQSMYGQDILDQVADQSRQIAERLDGSAEIPVEVALGAVVTDSDQIAPDPQ